MSNELMGIDAVKMANDVKERIKQVFVSSIPDDQFQQTVKVEIEAFFRVQKDGYGNYNRPSKFAEMVQSELCALVKEKLQEKLRTEYESTDFDSEKQCYRSNKLVEEMIVNNGDNLILSMMRGAVQNALNNMRNNM